MAKHFAARIEREGSTLDAQIALAYRLAIGRVPKSQELDALVEYSRKHGLANACRVVFNLNEFMFVD